MGGPGNRTQYTTHRQGLLSENTHVHAWLKLFWPFFQSIPLRAAAPPLQTSGAFIKLQFITSPSSLSPFQPLSPIHAAVCPPPGHCQPSMLHIPQPYTHTHTHVFLLICISLFTSQILPAPLSQMPSLHPLSSSLRRWQCVPGYPPTLVLQVSARLGASSPTEARLDSPVGEWIPQSGYSFRECLCSSCWGIHMETELHVYYIGAWGTLFQPTCVLWLVAQSLRDLSNPGYLTLLVLLWGSRPLQGLQSFPQFFYKSCQLQCLEVMLTFLKQKQVVTV